MNPPAQDPYWSGTTDFIRDAIGEKALFIGPRELQPYLPGVFSYDWVHSIEVLGDFRGVAVHKGLMHELPVPVLRTVSREWKCVFANEVFLFFMPPTSALPGVSGEHLGVFHDKLAALEKQDESVQEHRPKATVCVVVASGPPSGLEKVLHSLSVLHLETVVVPAGGDPGLPDVRRDICDRFRARWETPTAGQGNVSPQDALRTGVELLLAEERNAWIASFDDSVVARPDFLAVMEKWRHSKARPLLGGFWEEADGLRRSWRQDGFDLVVPLRPNRRFLYGHRNYWARRPATGSTGPDRLSHSTDALVIPGLVIPQAE